MSKTRLYVGNLSYVTTEETLARAFSEFGTVADVNIIIDRQSGRSKGFGFVEMGSVEEAEAAKAALDGSELDGRTINVANAREQEQRGPRSVGGGHSGSHGGYSGGHGGDRRGGGYR